MALGGWAGGGPQSGCRKSSTILGYIINKHLPKDTMSSRMTCAKVIKPVTDEQVFYDKFLCDKFYLLVCTRNFDNFFYDKCTCSKASMLAFFKS